MYRSLGLLGLAAVLAPATTAQIRMGGLQDLEGAWKLLAKKYDKNKDGRISQEEYDRGEAKFQAYDRNGDGLLTRADFDPETRRRGFGRRGGGGGRGQPGRGRFDREAMTGRMVGRMLARPADADKDGKTTEKEWTAYLKKYSEDGILDLEKLAENAPRGRRGGFGRRGGGARGGGGEGRGGRGGRAGGFDMSRMLSRMLDTDQDGEVALTEVFPWFAKLDKNKDEVLVPGEIGIRGGPGRAEEGLPRKGDPAPDFKLPKLGNRQELVHLAGFAGKKPVALIFGSYT